MAKWDGGFSLCDLCALSGYSFLKLSAFIRLSAVPFWIFLGVLGDLGGSIIVSFFLAALASWRFNY